MGAGKRGSLVSIVTSAAWLPPMVGRVYWTWKARVSLAGMAWFSSVVALTSVKAGLPVMLILLDGQVTAPVAVLDLDGRW